MFFGTIVTFTPISASRFCTACFTMVPKSISEMRTCPCSSRSTSLRPEGSRREIAERVNAVGKREIVVDRLRHVNDAKPTGGCFREAIGAVRRVVTADGDEAADAELVERRERGFEELRILRRVRACDA